MTLAPTGDAPAVPTADTRAADDRAAAPEEGRDLRRTVLLDALLAVAVASISLPSLLLLYGPIDAGAVEAGVAIDGITWPSQGWSILYVVASTAPLALRRIWPRTVHGVVLALSLVPYMVQSIVVFDTTPIVVSMFSVASLLRGWRFPVAAAVASVAATTILAYILQPAIDGLPAVGWQDVLFALPYTALPVALAVVAGRALQRERIRAEAHQRATVAAVLASEARAGAAVAAERRRLAAELHDIVAHHVSLMVVQAEAGPYAAGNGAGTSPGNGAGAGAAGASATFGAIADRGRTALGELDRLLGVLRREGDGVPGATAPLAPLPTLAEVPELVASAGRAGVPITLVRFDPPPAIDAALSATGHRIVQECITNMVKHGDHGEPATLSVSHEAGALRITSGNRVTGNRVGPAARAATDRDGHGLLSIRSRVEVFGGSLRIDEHDGRFQVEAVLPLGATAPNPAAAV